jgi:hypothetical protein
MLQGLFISLLTLGAAHDGSPEARTFELEEGEISRFGSARYSLMPSVWIQADEEPPEGLSGLPEFIAERPLFGAYPLDVPGLLDTEGSCLFFALDKRKATDRRYSRIYLDLDRDGDLSDEEPRRTSKEFELEFDLGEGYGRRSIELKPRVRNRRNRPAALSLRPTVGRHGKVEIGGEKFEAFLSQSSRLVGHFDQPDSPLVLQPRPDAPREDRLGSGRLIGGEYYVFSATPDGSRLTVTPYAGDLGVFRIGAGGRDVEEMEVGGYLLGDFDAPIGTLDEKGRPDPAAQCQLPVGSYRPHDLTVRYGSLIFDASRPPYYAGRPETPDAPPIEIREDRPFVLDFSESPEIHFTDPENEERFERGDMIRVEALLICPKLGLMISDIARRREGRILGFFKRTDSLDPKVSVLDSAGKVRATGKMPFG